MGSPPLLAQGHRVSGRETPGAWFPVVGEVLSSHLDAVPGFGPPSLEREGCGFNGPHLAEAGSSVTLVADPVLEGEDLREGPGPGGFPLHPKLLPREGALAHAFWRVRFDMNSLCVCGCGCSGRFASVESHPVCPSVSASLTERRGLQVRPRGSECRASLLIRLSDALLRGGATFVYLFIC